MPEVAEGAGLLFDPRNPASITRSMADVLLDAELRKRMETRGLQRAAHFNWRKSALATLDIYREVVAESSAETKSRSAIESPVVAPLRPHGKR
jgi:glycosyltransferase involved in cell wall biosynthesis